MPAPLVSALSYLLMPIAARQAALRAGLPEEVAPPGVAPEIGSLANLYGLYVANTGTPDDFQRLLYGTGPAYDPRNYPDPSFEDSMRALQEERDRAMGYGYAYPQEGGAPQTPPGYVQPTEEELRGLGAANGGLAALLRNRYAQHKR